MQDLPQYTSDNLAFNNFLQSLLEGEAQASKTVLRIFCKSFFIYLVTKSSKRSITRSIKLLWLESGRGKNSKRLLEVHSQRDCRRSWIKFIIVVGVK